MLRKIFLLTCNILVLFCGLGFLTNAISSFVMCFGEATYTKTYLPQAIIYTLIAAAVLSLSIIALTKTIKVLKNDDTSRISSILLVIAASLVITMDCYVVFNTVSSAHTLINLSKEYPNDPYYIQILVSNIISLMFSSLRSEMILALAVLSFFNFKKKEAPRPVQ